MSAPKDRLFRHLAMLRLIPRAPKSISTTDLLDKLKAECFDIDMRSLQRDLVGRLSLDFPLQCDESQRPYRWSFSKDTPQFDFPALDTPTALAFVLAGSHLRKLLPPSVLGLLAPHFDLAQRQIFGLERNNLAHWVKNVRALPNGKALQPAEVDPLIWAQVAAALLERRQLKILYLSRSKGEYKTLCLHPVGMVSRHS
ncbi:TPA: WYL domain-containing protein, partial [Pseudomonas aeruginosa]|nr:WYL domain-containing protein [Pseudomonas aeruginosa]